MSQTSLSESGFLVPSKRPPLDTQAFAPSGADGVVDEGAGRIVVDEDEQAGALVMAAGHVTPEAVNFMVSQARGPLRDSLLTERLESLRLPVALRSSDGSPVLSDADERGALIGAGGEASPILYTPGSLRKGNLWETIAVPETRTQAATLADNLLKRFPESRIARAPRSSPVAGRK